MYDLAKEGGHSEHRVLHYKDVTGYEIESVLLKQIHENENIEILTHYFCLELITQHHLGRMLIRVPKILTVMVYMPLTQSLTMWKIYWQVLL